MGATGEGFSELGTGAWESLQRGQGVLQHGLPSEPATLLVERPESLDIVGVELKELLEEALGNFGGREVHLVEGTEQRQQIEPRRFQAGAQAVQDFDRRTRGHGPSMRHRGAGVKELRAGGEGGPRPPSRVRPEEARGLRCHPQVADEFPVIVEQEQA